MFISVKNKNSGFQKNNVLYKNISLTLKICAYFLQGKMAS